MRTAILFLLAFIVGYYFSLLVSHPEKKKNRLPRIKFGSIELLPNLKFHGKHKTYHIHHWVFLPVLLALGAVAYEGLIRSPLVHGVTVGGILQGLRYKDRFKFRHPRQFPPNKR